MFEIIAGGSEEIFNYLLKWMARLVQDPGGERIGVSIVMRGKMGVGKGVFTTQFGEIFGSHFLHISNPTHLVGKFNNHFKSAILVFVDEGNWAGNKTAEGVLKALITERHLMIEPKGKDPFPVENHIHLIFASNNMWVVPAGLEERRFLVLDVSDKHMQDHGYFGAIIDQMNNGGREALLYDLLEMNVKDEDLRKIPRTSALLDQIVLTMPTARKFWLERLRAGTLLKGDWEWKEFVITEGLYGQYLEFAQAVGDKNALIDRQFGKELRRLCPDIKRVKRAMDGRDRWVLRTPPLDTCRAHFEKAVHMKINWGSEECGNGES
jgi:phage/plasmid-associated DNA primase